MNKPGPRWQGFERLAARILNELSPAADVHWNDHIEGQDSKTNRQIDVSIRARVEGRPILVIVQARDKGKPADVNDVGEFASVIRDVRATKGILICRRGFTRSAETYARNIGIELCNLHDAESKDWRLEVKIPILWIDLEPSVRVQFSACFQAGDSPMIDGRGAPVLTKDGGQTRVNPLSTFERAWNEGKIPRDPGRQHRVCDPTLMSLLVQDAAGARVWRPADQAAMVYTVKREAWLGYFTPARCRGILRYLDERSFTASYLPIGEVPVERGPEWTPIDDPDKLAVSVRGTLVTSSSYKVLQPGAGRFNEMHLQLIGERGGSPELDPSAKGTE